MLYLLEFRIDEKEECLAIENARSLDFFYTQEFSWTTGHFIIESIKDCVITTLIAFPHVEYPYQDLIDIQEYLLDKMNIHYERVPSAKIITKVDEEISIKMQSIDTLIIRSLSQDCFFNKILDLSIRRKSSYIAAIFFKHYFYEGLIYKNIIKESSKNSDYNTIKVKTKQLIDSFYINHDEFVIPIYIINTQNKNKFKLIRQSIIFEVKEKSRLELDKSIYTPIKENTIFSVVESIKTNSFKSNIVGQIWDISFDLNLNSYSLLKVILKKFICCIVKDFKYQTLIIVLNTQYLPLNELFGEENMIIVY